MVLCPLPRAALVMAVSMMLPITPHHVAATTAVMSNLKLPIDQNGQPLITGEASVMVHEGVYWFYFNNWGSCPGVDCCNSSAGCASCCFDHPPSPYAPGCGGSTNGSNPYGLFHTIQVYKTADFTTWTNMGVALPLSARKSGIEFRPCVVFNKKTNLFLMWFENRGGGSGYTVATSTTPQGPFNTTYINVDMPGKGKIGDYNILIDDDGIAYHVRTGFDVVKLNENYTGPADPPTYVSLSSPGEGPTMFKYNGTYFITTGNGCCACIGGSNIFVSAAPTPLGPWTSQGDIGSIPGHNFDKHSPNNYVTKAQGSAAFLVGGQIVYLGNQWNSGLQETPPGPRNHDLLYWGTFKFLPGPGPSPPQPIPPPPPIPSGPLTCWSEIQDHKNGRQVTFSCPTGQKFSKVNFAAFGTPIGNCSNPEGMQHDKTCDAQNVSQIVSNTCLTHSSCTINPSTQVFGDPCLGTVKRLLVSLNCSATHPAAQDLPSPPPPPPLPNIHIDQMVWQDSITLEF